MRLNDRIMALVAILIEQGNDAPGHRLARPIATARRPFIDGAPVGLGPLLDMLKRTIYARGIDFNRNSWV